MTDYRTVIAEYEALVEKALTISGEWPEPGYQPRDEDICRLIIEGETASLKWMKPSEWGDHYEEEARTFPAALLAMDDEQFYAECARVKHAAERKRLNERRAEVDLIQREERATLARLKAKYEGGAS